MYEPTIQNVSLIRNVQHMNQRLVVWLVNPKIPETEGQLKGSEGVNILQNYMCVHIFSASITSILHYVYIYIYAYIYILCNVFRYMLRISLRGR